MCFSLTWVAEFLVMCVVIGACVAIFNLLWPRISAVMGPLLGSWAALVLGIIKIVIIALLLIWAIWFAVDAIGCLLGYGGAGAPHLFAPRR